MIVIASVPHVETDEPIMAPALLKSVLATHGIKATALDLNIDVVNRVNAHKHKQKLLDFFYSEQRHPEVKKDIQELIEYCSDKILSKNPTVISLSLLVYTCQFFTRWLCHSLKHKSPDTRIVIGGAGIRNFVGENNLDFCYDLKKQKLIDDFVVGDADETFVDFIRGNKNLPGINTIEWKQVSDLNKTVYPDYDDYNFDDYANPVIPIIDSRGCVKNCEFCDVIEYWKKYQYRTADNIWEEMMYQLDRYNVRTFSLRSSLTNGNLREFRKLITLMSEYNEGLPDEEQLRWNGYFILRNAKHHTDDLWHKIKKSNGTLLIGIESVVSDVRHGLGKTFEDEDIDWNLDLAQKYGIPIVLLIIVAYPTETLEDFEYTKQWFRDRKQYAGDSVIAVSLSFASILPGTKLARKSKEYNIKRGDLPSIWYNEDLGITSKQRTQYLRDLYDICQNECGFNTLTNEETLKHTEEQDNF